MRILIDTNVLISGIFFRGPEHDLLNRLRARHRGVVSDSILAELRDVCRRKFPDQRSDVQDFLEFSRFDVVPLEDYASLIPTVSISNLKDRHVLAAAETSGCEVVVTGDRALLGLKSYRGVQILSARQLINRL